MLGLRGIRVISVAPSLIWTPLIPATTPPEKVEHFGEDTPLGRPGQPAELAGAHVLLASDDGSYTSGSRVPVTGAPHPLDRHRTGRRPAIWLPVAPASRH